MIRFTKMHGVGNDFIILDPAELAELDLPDLARKACDRHFGVGADGILVPAPSEGADLRMIYHNSDGSPSEMCGNGIRCLARYARDRGLIDGEVITIETGAGIKRVFLEDDGSSRVEMGTPTFEGEVGLHGYEFLRVSMGNPHAVTFLESRTEVEEVELGALGPSIERDPVFPHRTNVEFAHVSGLHEVRMRIWERGAGETLASGSGSCATVVAAVKVGLARGPVRVILDGGVVEVEWAGGEEPVRMSGPAEYVCEGKLLDAGRAPGTGGPPE